MSQNKTVVNQEQTIRWFEIKKPQTRRKMIYVLCIALCKELCFWIWPDRILLNTVLKLIAGAAMFLLCCRKEYRPASAQEKEIVAAVLLFVLADLLIKWKFLVSGGLFLAGHLLLIVSFWMEEKPTRKGILIWIVLTLAESPCMIWLLRKYGFSLAVGCAGAAYGSILALMVVCAVRQETILTCAAVLFACSDTCLALYKALPSQGWIHIPCILLFYLAMGLFLIYCSDYANPDSPARE